MVTSHVAAAGGKTRSGSAQALPRRGAHSRRSARAPFGSETPRPLPDSSLRDALNPHRGSLDRDRSLSQADLAPSGLLVRPRDQARARSPENDAASVNPAPSPRTRSESSDNGARVAGEKYLPAA